MKYLHYISNKQGEQIESIYTNHKSIKYSLVCMAHINCAEYKIWNRETNEVKTVEINIVIKDDSK